MILIIGPTTDSFFNFVRLIGCSKIDTHKVEADVRGDIYKFVYIYEKGDRLRGGCIKDYFCLDCKESDNDYLFNSIIRPMKLMSGTELSDINGLKEDEYWAVFSDHQEINTGYISKKMPIALLGSSSLFKVKRVL